MLAHGTVSPAPQSDGYTPSFRAGYGGESIFTRLHYGKWTEAALRGQVFWGESNSGVLETVSTNVSATTLFNPPTSGKLISVIGIEVTIFTALPGTPVVGTYGVYVNSNIKTPTTGTLQTNVFPAVLGSGYLPSGRIYLNPTLPSTPTLFRNIQNKFTGDASTSMSGDPFRYYFDGTCILQPGAAISLFQNVSDGTNASIFQVWIWEEI